MTDARDPSSGAAQEPPIDLRGSSPDLPVSGADSSAGSSDVSSAVEDDDRRSFQARWQELQAGFVDEPRRTVEEADALVAEVTERVIEALAGERASLQRQWDRSDASTESLRVALQGYRSFLERLLER